MLQLLRVQVILKADPASNLSTQGCDNLIYTLHEMGMHTQHGPGCTDMHADKTTTHTVFISTCVYKCV